MISERDRLVPIAVERLRRASDQMLQSGARSYFVPRGCSFRIDLNVLQSYLLRGLAAGIERYSARVSARKRA